MSAITGLTVVYGHQATAPPGFTLIAGGEYVYLCYSTVPDLGPPITAIQAAPSKKSYSEDKSVKPAGFTVIPDDLNSGTRQHERYVYLSFSTSPTGLPITGVDVISGKTQNTWPSKEFLRVDQDLNEGANGHYIYVSYKQSC